MRRIVNSDVLKLLGHGTVLTLVLGCVTAAIWIVFGRRAFMGALGDSVADAGLVIYGLLFVSSLVIGYVWAHWLWRSITAASAIELFGLAWLLQGVIVFVVFSGDSDLRSAEIRIVVWLVATGFVLQPVAAVIGARLQARR